MYLSFYGLSREPFHITPDPEFLFMSPSHKEAFAALVYGVEQRKGFICLIGEVGTGKTTILRAYLKEIFEGATTYPIYLFNPALTFESLLSTILGEMGVEVKERIPAEELLKCLHKTLIKEYKCNRNVVLLIDEAQNMPNATLESLRMLSNLETTTDKLIQIVLVGQPELDRKLRRFSLRQLRARIAVQARIRPLTPTESRTYIRHRLAQAGSSDVNLFTPTAVRAIIKYAKGNPRAINILCDNALVTGYGSGRRPITRRKVNEVIDDLKGKSPTSPLRRILATLALFLAIGIFIALSVQIVAKDLVLPLVDASLVNTLPRKARDTEASTRAWPQKTDVKSVEALKEPQEMTPAVPSPPARRASETIPEPQAILSSVPEPPPARGTTETVPTPQEIPPGTAALPPTSSADAPRPVQATRVVLKGDHLVGLITGVYGRCDNDLIALVKRHNPSIQNPDLLSIGDVLIFPKTDASPPVAGTTSSASNSGSPANRNPQQ